MNKISECEAVLRNIFKASETNDELKTSSFDVDRGGWIERDNIIFRKNMSFSAMKFIGGEKSPNRWQEYQK